MCLYEQHCLTDTPPQLLTKEKLDKLITEIPQWNISNDSKNISRNFKFDNYSKTLKFINAVAIIISKENHHPDINFGYNHCTISFTTHSSGGITLFDLICAAKIDQLKLSSELNHD